MLEESSNKYILNNNNQISFTVTTGTWDLSTERTRTWSSIVIRMRTSWWFLFVWIADVAIQSLSLLYRINKDRGDESLSLLVFQRHVVNVVFLKYSKLGGLSSSHIGIRNIPSDVCNDNTKHYQVQSEHRCIPSPFKHVRRSVLA